MRPLPQAQAETLVAIAARYAEGCPFKPGDLITPRVGYNLRGEGEPCVVVETFERRRNFEHVARTSIWEDMRYVRLAGPDNDSRADALQYVAFEAESWQFEPWSAK